MLRTPTFAILSALVLMLAACSDRSIDQREASPLTALAPARAADEFGKLCLELKSGDNPYYGNASRRRYQDWVDQANPNPLAHATALSRLALTELQWGEAASAASRLDEAHDLARRAGLDPALTLDILRNSALAHLRVGEQQNCVQHRGASACILPFDQDAVHREKGGSSAALSRFQEYLESDPGDPVVTWLMNVSAMTLGEWPTGVPEGWRAELPGLREPRPFSPFVDRARERGLDINRSSGGVVVDDFDGDGDFDLITSSIDPCASLELWINDGNGNFVERTEGSGLESQLGGLNLVHADFDNDRDLDLLVLRGGWFGADGEQRNSLLRNDGNARFDDVTFDAGLAEPAYPTQTAAWGDFDNDGDLDLYIGNEAAEDLYAEGEGAVAAYPSQLFRNDGFGRFIDIAKGAGVSNDRFAKGVAWGDYDNDGDLDLYVSNIGKNRLYRNDSPRGFLDVAEDAGVAEPIGRSFASWFFDFDNDGWLDLFVADYGATLEQIAAYQLGLDVEPGGRPKLFRNLRDGRFEDAGERLGFTEPLLPMGANFGDLDQDGWLDIYLGTGAPSYEALMPNRLYRNQFGDRFEDVTDSARVGHIQKGHGIAIADLDGDGDQDIFEQMGGAFPGDGYPSSLYDHSGSAGQTLELTFSGVEANSFGVGSRIEIQIPSASGVSRSVHRVVGTGSSFGGSPIRMAVGTGPYGGEVDVEVYWVGAFRTQRYEGLKVGSHYLLKQGGEIEKRP